MNDAQFDAEIDKAMALLDDDKIKEARAIADKLLKQPARRAESLLLSAMTAVAEEEYELAEKQVSESLKLDPTLYPAYRLAIDLASSSGRHEEARALIDRALEETEEEEDFVDAVLLKAELELEGGDEAAATAAIGELPPVDLEDPEMALRAGNIHLECGQFEEARRYFKMAIASDAESPDAHYGLGLVAEREGNDDERIKEFLIVRKLDLALPRSPHQLDVESLEKIADEELKALPDRARQLIGNVPILIEDYPSEALVKDGVDPRVLGLFSGEPLTEQSALGAPPHLETVHLFVRNIEMEADSEDAVADEVRVTILHELGHFFGLDEDELEDRGLA